MGKIGIVNNNIQRIMQIQSINSELKDEVLFGMWVEVIKEEDQWAYIRTQYEYNGYILKKHLVFNEELVNLWMKKEKHVVMHSLVDIIDVPKYQGNIIETITRGALVILTGDISESWVEIILPDGRNGWIKEAYIKKWIKHNRNNQDNLRRKLVENAKLYLGTQYRWGGKTSIGIDCSGLCSMAYLLEGIVVYRDAILREEYMRKIERKEMKEGDLIFWPGHIGMYIGNGRFIHSTSSRDGVVINSFNKGHNDYREDLDKGILQIGTIF